MERHEKQAELLSLFARSPVQQALGTRLHYDDRGGAVVTFPRNRSYDNALGGTHGGILSTLLDTVGWFAAAAAYDCWIVTVDLHVQLLLPADADTLSASGHALRTGARLAMTRMQVRREDGTVLAAAQGTYSVTRVPFR